MRKKITIFLILIFVLGLAPVNFSSAQDLSNRLSGKILLQVENVGQAWYIDPETKERAFLGRPADAFKIMRELGLGISEDSYNSFNGYAPSRLSGKILLRVEANGEAYYIFPDDLKMHYLGKPADAFDVMREKGLGITNADLEKVPVFLKYAEQVGANTEAIDANTQAILDIQKQLDEQKANEEKPKITLPDTSDLTPLPTPPNNKQEANDYIDNQITSINSIISKFLIIEGNNQNFVQDTKNELSEYSYSNLVQSSGQQLINEVENQNFIINKVFDVCNQIITEFNSLKNTGDTTSNNYKSLENQLTNYINQYGVAENKAKALIKTHVSNMASALDQKEAEVNKEVEKLQNIKSALDKLTSLIDIANNDLLDLSNQIDEKNVEIEKIKNQAIPMNIINGQLATVYDEYNAIVNEYNIALEAKNVLANLYSKVYDYYENDTPLLYSDKLSLQNIGIYL